MPEIYTSKQTVITFPDLELDDVTKGIASGSLQVEEILCETNPVFGRACSNRFEAQVYGIGNVSGQKIYVYQIDEEENEYPIFTGWIDSSKLDDMEYYRNIVAYDAIHYYGDTNVAEWWTEFWKDKTYTTLRELRLSLCQYVGIPSSTESLPNDSFIVNRNVTISMISFIDMLYYICELSGVIPNMNRRGILEYILLGDTDSAIDISGKYQSTASQFEEYTTDRIDQIQFLDANGDVYYTVGQGESAYTLGKNFLLFDKETAEVKALGEELLNAIGHVSYKPMSLVMFVTALDLQLGQMVETSKGFTYVMNNYLSGPTLIDQSISSNGSETLAEATTNFDPFYQYNNAKFASITKSIEGMTVSFGEVKTIANEALTKADEAKQDVSDMSQTLTDQINASMNTVIQQTSQQILASVEESYYSKDQTDEILGKVSTEVEVTKDAVEFRFNELKQSTDASFDELNNQLSEQTKYVRIENGNIILGEAGNELTLVLKDDRISFAAGKDEDGNDIEVAYFTNQKLFVTDGEFTHSLQLGNFGFIPRANGNLSFMKVK